MKKILLVFLFILCIFGIFTITKQHKQTITIKNQQFFIEMASTPKEQEIGLAKYTYIPKDKGMYFPFAQPANYLFWMKDMKFPIDIIFIRSNTIIDIYPSVPIPQVGQIRLPTYGPSSPADAVLEINAGLSKEYGFQRGDAVKLSQ